MSLLRRRSAGPASKRRRDGEVEEERVWVMVALAIGPAGVGASAPTIGPSRRHLAFFLSLKGAGGGVGALGRRRAGDGTGEEGRGRERVRETGEAT
jgi:hypothetical protein